MDGDVTLLKPGRAKALLLIAASAALVALCVWAATDPEINAVRRALMGAGAGFFGLGVLAGAAFLLPGFHSMRLAPEGLAVRVRFRDHHYPWDAFGPFRAERPPAGGPLAPRVVVFDYTPEYRRSEGIEAACASNKERFGHEGAFQTQLYGGVGAREVAGMLNAYRDRYGRGDVGGGPDG